MQHDPVQSQLFTLRVWNEERSRGPGQVRMQVRHVMSGEVQYLVDWSALENFVKERVFGLHANVEEEAPDPGQGKLK